MPRQHPAHSLLTPLPFGWSTLPDGVRIFRPRRRTYDAHTDSRIDVIDDCWFAVHPPIPDGEFQGAVQWSEYAVLGDGKIHPIRTSLTSGGWLNWPGEPAQTIAEVLASLPGLGSWPVPFLGTLWMGGVEGIPEPARMAA